MILMKWRIYRMNKRNYSTQMEAAKKNICTPEMEIVSKKEVSGVDAVAY